MGFSDCVGIERAQNGTRLGDVLLWEQFDLGQTPERQRTVRQKPRLIPIYGIQRLRGDRACAKRNTAGRCSTMGAIRPGPDAGTPENGTVEVQTDPDLWDSAIAWGSSVRKTEHGWEMFYYGSNSTWARRRNARERYGRSPD